MKAQLEALKDGNSNAYSHLVQVLKQMILNNDRNGYQLFEYYSQTIKSGQNIQPSLPQETAEELKEYVQKCKGLLNKPNVGTEEEPQQPGPCGYVANLMEEAKMLEKAGVGFGEETTYLIFKAIQKFVITKQVKQAKFWGKILGKDRDYYIVEVAAEGGEEGELPPEVEPKGTGINKNTYWVASDLMSGEWKELPIITPEQLNASRQIKYLFTGDLGRIICTNPHFKGKQSHLLKCQIVRISFSCQIVPRTMFNVNAEDKKEIEPAGEEWKLPNFKFLSSLNNWVHHPQNILKCGRLTLMKPTIPEGEEVDEQKLMKELQSKDPLQQRLKTISEDKLGDEAGWALKVVGDTNEYRALSKGKQTINYGYICIKSLIWKGWNLVFHNKQWCSIYIGQGSKTVGQWYYPSSPQTVLQEKEDREEQPEPNFPAEVNKVEAEAPPE